MTSHLEGLVVLGVNGHHVPVGGPQVLYYSGPEPVQVLVQLSGGELGSLRQGAVGRFFHSLPPLLLQAPRPRAPGGRSLAEGPIFVNLLLLLEHLHTNTGEVQP